MKHRKAKLEWDQALPVDICCDYPELVLRSQQGEKVLPPQFIVLSLSVMDKTVEITVKDLLDAWTHEA